MRFKLGGPSGMRHVGVWRGRYVSNGLDVNGGYYIAGCLTSDGGLKVLTDV